MIISCIKQTPEQTRKPIDQQWSTQGAELMVIKHYMVVVWDLIKVSTFHHAS